MNRTRLLLLLLTVTPTACSLFGPDNHPPVIELRFPPWAANPDNATVIPNLDHFFSDPDHDRLTYSATSYHPAIRVETIEAELVVTPEGVPPQTTTILVTAYDPAGDSVAQTLDLVFPHYAILPITAQTRDTVVSKGDVVELAFEPWRPESDLCVEGSPAASPWAACDDFRAAGWLVYDNSEFADLLAELDCDDAGHPAVADLTDCWSLTVWRRGTGPGLTDLGGLKWLVDEGCRNTWASYTLIRFVGKRRVVFPTHRIFTDTTRIHTLPC